LTNKLTLYPPTKPNTNHNTHVCMGNEDISDEESALQTPTLNQMVLYNEETKDAMINNFIINSSSFEKLALTFFNYLLDQNI